jgi:hypothetical protein
MAIVHEVVLIVNLIKTRPQDSACISGYAHTAGNWHIYSWRTS